jgi:general nucleoside transport system permease protein
MDLSTLLSLAPGILAAALRMATPIALAAYAGILAERAGVVNIAIEGMMLMAAMVGDLVMLYTGNIWAGVFAGVLSAGLLALLHAVLSIKFMTDQIISGTAINILAGGITGFAYLRFLATPTLSRPSPSTLQPIEIPLLKDIPVLGDVMFQNRPIVYAMLILTVVIYYVLFHTPWGLRVRAVGEHPKAADTMGINVYKVRYISVFLSGLVAGLGGVWFSLEQVGHFDMQMIGGKGFIGLAAMIFGRWNPIGALGAALLFGLPEALQINLAMSLPNIPYQFMSMIPYILTIIVLTGVVGRAVAPAADGKPYEKG